MVILEYSRGFGHDTNGHKIVHKQKNFVLRNGPFDILLWYRITETSSRDPSDVISQNSTVGHMNPWRNYGSYWSY
jgi:hypothetical protein